MQNRGILIALRAAAIVVIATGLGDVLASALPRFEPLYLYLGGIALVALLDGILVALLTAVLSLGFYALLFMPRADVFTARIAFPVIAMAATALVGSVVRGVVRVSRRRGREVERVFQPPLLETSNVARVADNAEVLAAIDDLRTELRTAIAELAATRDRAGELEDLRRSQNAERAAVEERARQVEHDRDWALKVAEESRVRADREKTARIEAERQLAEARDESATMAGRLAELELSGHEGEKLRLRVTELEQALGAAAPPAEFDDLRRALGEARNARDRARAEAMAEKQRADAAERALTADHATAEGRVGEERAARESAERLLGEERAARARLGTEAAVRETALAAERTARENAERAVAAERAARENAERAVAAERTSRETAERALAEERATREASERAMAEERAIRQTAGRALAEERATRETTERALADERVTRETAERALAEERASRETAERALAEERASRETAERALAEERATRETAERALAEERATRETAERALAAERTSRESAERALAGERASREAAERALADERATRECLQSEAAEFDTKLQTIAAHLASDHEADLGHAVAEREEARAETRAARARIAALEEALADERANRERLESEAAQFDTRLQTIVTHLASDHETDLGQALSDKEEARAEARALSMKLTTMQRKLEDAEALLAETREAAQREIDTLRAQQATPGAPAAPRPRVLVVHPDADVRAAAGASLERAGYEVVGAADGLEALRVAIAQQPEVVIAESSMPKMDGRELCQLLKSQLKTAHIRFILLMRANDEAPRGELLPDEILRKPVPVETLRATLASLLASNTGR